MLLQLLRCRHQHVSHYRRWKTNQAKNGYVKDKLKSLFQCPKVLHISLDSIVLFLYFRRRAPLNEMTVPDAVFVFIKISYTIFYNHSRVIRV